ncbi:MULTISPECIES: PAS domain-containing protein [Agrobacterium]|uniref:PAS domain-containing protein n=1 Tax=Agrobacterium burrii TaxID=2815339 RepID=A0ABS3EK49_9HYPH|nr:MULTISPECIES: PAS domain-containing protein [Agrobacterium]MBO0132324.1 PAS domain-containing protein [Agrobacterium burrii]MQB09612.1 PAS domain-containing protein [Agrobacterium sp. ICMP 6402]NTZ91051.1 PAS domain-containing protein [Agrobacterium tumefaciens]
MKSMAGLDIYNYWDELRGNRPAPRREDIDPARLKHHLGDLFILTEKGEEAPFFRLAGTRICDLFGRELRDRPFSELWPAAKAVFPCRVARGILQHQLPVVFDVEAEDDFGAAPLAFEMLLLPLRTDEGAAPRLLGALLPAHPRHEFATPINCLWMKSSRLLQMDIAQTQYSENTLTAFTPFAGSC